MCRISMPRCPGRRVARAPVTAPSRCARSGKCSHQVAAMTPEDDQPARAAAEAVARRSYGKLVAFLAARTRDVAGAEDALSEAFAAALVDWPAHGVPNSPEGWLMTVARRKQIDAARQRRTTEDASDHLRFLAEWAAAAADQRR